MCLHAPTATIWEGKRNDDYVLETSFNNKVISVNGKENLFELGLGIYCNDFIFPVQNHEKPLHLSMLPVSGS